MAESNLSQTENFIRGPLEAGESENLSCEVNDHENNFKVDEPQMKITEKNDFKEGDPAVSVGDLNEMEHSGLNSVTFEESEQLFEKTLTEIEEHAEEIASKEEMRAALECLRKSLNDQETEVNHQKQLYEIDIQNYKLKTKELEFELVEMMTKMSQVEQKLEKCELNALKIQDEKTQADAAHNKMSINFEQKIEELNSQISALQQTLIDSGKNSKEEELQSQIQLLRSEKEQTEKQLCDLEVNYVELQGQCQSLEQDAVKTALEKEDVSQAFDMFKVSANQQFLELNEKIENTHNLAEEKEKELINHQQILQKCRKDFKLEKETLIKEMNKEKQDLKYKLEQLEKEKELKESQLENKLTLMDETNANLNQHLKELQQNSQRTECEKKVLESQIEEFKLEKIQFENILKDKQALNEELIDLKKTTEESNAGFLDKIEELHEKNANLQEIFKVEKEELENSLSETKDVVQQLENKVLNLEQEKRNLVEDLEKQIEQGQSFKVEISQLENCVAAAESNNSKSNETLNEIMSSHRDQLLRLQMELSERETKLNESDSELISLKIKFEEALTQKLEGEKSIYLLNQALKEREQDLKSKIIKIEETVATTDKFQRDLQSLISENEGLRRALSEIQTKFLDGEKGKDEIVSAFLDFQKTTESHKEQLLTRINELETSYRSTESKLVKQNESLKKEIDDFKIKEEHMIQALAHAEIQLRQLQVPRVNSIHTRSQSQHKNSSPLQTLGSLTRSKRTESTKKLDASKHLDQLKKLEKLDDATKKLETKKSDLLKKRETIKKLEIFKKDGAETSNSLDSAKKLDRFKAREGSSSRIKKDISAGIKPTSVSVPSNVSDSSLSDMESLQAVIKKKVSIKKAGEAVLKNSLDDEKDRLKALRNKFFRSRANNS